jgi:AcrR family transcriptional regulator
MTDSRDRIVEVASKILARDGREALTTRAVAAAANVQAPTIYRLFGDKRGLLDAVVAHGIAAYLQAKAKHPPIEDPIEDLRIGIDQHVEFGLANPAVYALMADPSLQLTAGRDGIKYLEQRIHRIALAGRLRVSEVRAVELVHAAGLGTVLALLDRPAAERDLTLAADARDAVIAAITTAPAAKTNKISTVAIALRAGLAEVTELTPRERDLLDEWLARIAKRRP